MELKRTVLGVSLISALALAFGASAQNVSEGEIDQTTGQAANAEQGGQANTNELKEGNTAQDSAGAPSTASESQDSNAAATGETTGQGQGVRDSGGEAAAGTHEDQGGDPTHGTSGHTGTGAGSSTDAAPEQSQ